MPKPSVNLPSASDAQSASTLPGNWISPELMAMNPEMVMHEMGLLKAEKEKDGDYSPGTAGAVNALRGHLDAEPYFRSSKGIRDYIPDIPYRVCREVRRKNPLVAAIINTRKRQMRPFSMPAAEFTTPGYQVVLRDTEASPTKKELEQIKWLEEFFYYSGRTDFKGWEDREDTLNVVLQKRTEDMLTIDQAAIEIRRNRAGDAVDFWMLDAGSIKRVYPATGFLGNRNDIDPRANMGWERTIQELIDQKVELIPDLEDIRFVQEMNGRIIAAFSQQDLIFGTMNSRTDMVHAGQGFSLVGQAIQVITAFMYSMAYNIEQFNTGTLPKIALVFKNGNFGEQQLMRFQDQWIANFRGIFGAWRIPMLNGDVQSIDLYKSARDMEFSQFVQFTSALICAVFGIDGQELGLRLNQAQNVLNENSDAKLKHSKDRGLHDLLGDHEFAMNMIMRRMKSVQTHSNSPAYSQIDDIWRKFRFEFTGLEPQDREVSSRLDNERVQNYMTINELRAEKDMPKLKGGDIVMNPTYLQAMQMEQQAAQEAGGGAEGQDTGADAAAAAEPSDEDVDAMLDEILADPSIEQTLSDSQDQEASQAVQKARRVRTMLI